VSEHLKQSVEAGHFGIMGEVDADAGAQTIKPANFERQTISNLVIDMPLLKFRLPLLCGS